MLEIKKFDVFEKIFNIDRNYENQYKNIFAVARFQKPDGSSHIIPLFYYGENKWGVRFSPNQIGKWNYIINSNNPQLDGKKGEFNCVNSSLRGGIMPMKDYPYHFQYEDGTPMWFFGDTQWRAFATEEENNLNRATVCHYIDVRAKQGFNYIHTDLMGGGGMASGEKIFNSFSQELINIDFFKEMDYRVQYMNQKGITSGIVLAWHQGNPAWESFVSEEACLRYARYIVARYSAYNVVFIVSGEWDQIQIEQKPLFNKIGKEIMTYDPHNRMRGIHPCQKLSVEEFAIEPWMSFGDYQQLYEAPHGGEATPQERKALHKRLLKTRVHNKPVINSEYAYYLRKMGGIQDYKNDIEGIDKPHSHTRRSFRRASWVLNMAGGYFVTGFGTTYFGGWRDLNPFNVDDPKNDVAENDLQNINNFFNKLEWWKLDVTHELVKSEQGYVYCLSDNKKTYVIYSEGTSSIEISLSDKNKYQAKLYDPRQGKYSQIEISNNDNEAVFQLPDEDDWVIVIKKV